MCRRVADRLRSDGRDRPVLQRMRGRGAGPLLVAAPFVFSQVDVSCFVTVFLAVKNTAEPAQQTLKQYRHQHRLERVPHTGRMAVERLDRRTHILAYNSILAYSPKGGVSQKQKGFRGDLETLAGG